MGNVLHHIVVPPAPETYASNKPVTDGFHTGQRTVTNLPTSIAAPSSEELSRMDSKPDPAWRIKGVG